MSENPYQYLDMSWRSALLLCLICPILVTAITLLFRLVERKASQYLALFLLLFCANVVPQVIGFAGFYQAFPGLTFAPFNNELWLGPLLLLHTLSITKHTIPRYVYWLLVPAALQTTYYVVAFLGLGDYQQKWAYNDAIHVPFVLPVESLLTIAIAAFCTWQAFVHVAQYKRELLDIESDQDTYDISWLGWMTALIGVLIVVWSGYEILYLVLPEFSYPDQYPFHVLFLVIVLILSQRALSSIRLPYPTPVCLDKAEQPSTNSVSIDTKQNDLVAQIHAGMKDAKWYLNRQFSLSDLARVLHTNETYVSKAINLGFNKNFNALINEARVKHAQQLIQTNPALKLSDVMYESGFSSKASFNRSFKLVSGQTPSQFQQALATSA